MTSTATALRNLVHSGIHRIGELEILTTVGEFPYILCHWQDSTLASGQDFGGLARHQGPASARDLSTYAADGSYRFAKAQVNLQRGWVMTLASEQELLHALDQFYPAAVGIYLAERNGTLEVEHLRDKLQRQTGMYRFARNISDTGAQHLVKQVCGPAHQCARRILWQLDAQTPLDDSEASRFNGIPGEIPHQEAIPLLCREACNHFVAECRKAAKAEFEQNQKPGP
jgi:sirohydrochlorin cobaltochelatase